MQTATPPDETKPVRSSRPEQVSHAANGAPAERDGFKKTKVGWIPEDWEVATIDSCIERINAGTSVGGEDRRIRDEEKGVLKVSAASYGIFDPSEHKVIPNGRVAELDVNPEPGKIIVSRANTFELVGASVYISEKFPDLFLPDKLWQITVDSGRVHARWLNYMLSSARLRFSIATAATGSSGSMKNISQKRFRKLKLPLPPLPEQRRIAAVLAAWDRALAQTGALLDAKQRRKKALMQQLLTGKTRLPEFEDQDWEEVQLGRYFEYFSERNSEDETYPVLSCSKVYGIIPQSERFDKRIASKDLSRYKIVERGDLVYDPMLLWDASIGFVDCVDEGVVSPAYYTFKYKGSEQERDFFRFLLGSHYVCYQYGAISQGTNARRQKAPREAFLKITAPMPAEDERIAIASILATCDEEIETLRAERDALRRQKKGMMQKLLTGRVRVPAGPEPSSPTHA